MSFSPASLQQRFAVLLIIPVTLLLIIMGVAGFFYARNMLLDQWRDAAILRLQRAAHEMDMHLSRIKDSIRLFHETPGVPYAESYHVWALEHLRRQEGIVDVKLAWTAPAEPSGAPSETVQPEPALGPGQHAMGKTWHLRRFHSGKIRDIAPPRFDARGEHGTLLLISDLLDDRSQLMGQLEVVCDFDVIFRHVVESGWWQSNKAFLVDEKGQILICTVPGRPRTFQDSNDPLERETMRTMATAPYGTLRGEGHPPEEVSGFYRLQEAPWFLVMIAPGRTILAPIIDFRWYYSLFSVGFIVLIIGLIRLVTMRTAGEIREVSQAALRLSHGEFGAPLPLRSRDEVGELTRSFNLMTSQLEERLHLKEAMSLAVEVQQNLLPASPPLVPGLDIAGRSLYCQETGGDYFDYILRREPSGSRRLCAAVGDVAGHGISAALLMTTVRALLRSRLTQPGPIAEAVCDINRLLYQDTAASGSFVTLFLLELDSAAGSLEWVRAGHDPAWLYCAATDVINDLGGPGMALGVDEACSYPSSGRATLGPGDVLLIGTDGIWETRNAYSEKFGKERVGTIARSHRHLNAEGILQVVLNTLEEFRGKAQQEDDITLLVIKAAGIRQA